MRDYNTLSKDLYETFSKNKAFNFTLEKKGLLLAYLDATTEQEEIEIAEKAQRIGMDVEILNQAMLPDLEKGAQLLARGAVYYPGDAHLNPRLFIEELLRDLRASGVDFITHQNVMGINHKAGKATSIKLSKGSTERVSHLLIATGAWSQKICKQLSIKISDATRQGLFSDLEKSIRSAHYSYDTL